jgi:hypothetical protein
MEYASKKTARQARAASILPVCRKQTRQHGKFAEK